MTGFGLPIVDVGPGDGGGIAPGGGGGGAISPISSGPTIGPAIATGSSSSGSSPSSSSLELGLDPRLSKIFYLEDTPGGDVTQALSSRPALMQGLILIGILLLAKKL